MGFILTRPKHVLVQLLTHLLLLWWFLPTFPRVLSTILKECAWCAALTQLWGCVSVQRLKEETLGDIFQSLEKVSSAPYSDFTVVGKKLNLCLLLNGSVPTWLCLLSGAEWTLNVPDSHRNWIQMSSVDVVVSVLSKSHYCDPGMTELLTLLILSSGVFPFNIKLTKSVFMLGGSWHVNRAVVLKLRGGAPWGADWLQRVGGKHESCGK